MASDATARLRRLLAGALEFPSSGSVWLLDTGLEFLAAEALAACAPERLRIVERDLLAARRLEAAFPALAIAHAARAEAAPGDFVVLPLDKDRRALFESLAALARRVGPGGRLAVYGSRREGVEPALAYLEQFCALAPAETRAGMRLVIAQPRAVPAPALPPRPQSYRAEARGVAVEVACRPGVFSWRALDGATAMMLAHCAPRDGDRLLDLGCGAGPVAALLLAEGRVQEATLVDTDALALEAAAETLARNGLVRPGVELLASDAGRELAEGRFDLVLCNPPLHRGFTAERDSVARMVEESARLLAARGRLYLVGPPALRLGQRLPVRFQTVERLHGDAALELFRASFPRRPGLSADAPPGS